MAKTHTGFRSSKTGFSSAQTDRWIVLQLKRYCLAGIFVDGKIIKIPFWDKARDRGHHDTSPNALRFRWTQQFVRGSCSPKNLLCIWARCTEVAAPTASEIRDASAPEGGLAQLFAFLESEDFSLRALHVHLPGIYVACSVRTHFPPYMHPICKDAQYNTIVVDILNEFIDTREY